MKQAGRPPRGLALSYMHPHGDSDTPPSTVGAGLTTAFIWAIPAEAQFISYLSNDKIWEICGLIQAFVHIFKDVFNPSSYI